MVQGDVDFEGIAFRSPEEQDLFIAGQRERVIAVRAEESGRGVVAREAREEARRLLYGAAKARERASRPKLKKIATLVR